MEDTTQCVVISHPLGPSPEQEVADKIKETFHERNTQGLLKNRLFEKHGIDTLVQIAVGPSAVGILLDSGEVIRLSLLSKTDQMLPPPVNPTQSNNSSQSASLRGSVPKFRRVMLSASSFRRNERGVVIDSRRPMLPASSVPEDLIAQAQVVLQGKSREVIVRELQRTNLNVNEAVNNLLSRDDDDEDDEGPGHGEVMLPEELISLLDPSSQHPLLEAADLYGADFEYILGRDRRRNEKEKEKKKDNSGSATPTSKSKVDLDDTVELWAETKGVPEGVGKFTMISATGTELLAVSDKGVLFSWPWSEAKGETQPHSVATRLIPADDAITDFTTSHLRIVVHLKSGKMGSWLDHRALGQRVCRATEVKPTSLEDDTITQLVASNHLAIARTSSNAFYWCGFYPFNDRSKLLEKERSKSKKHVTFDTSANEIKEGCEVRTKATPIYAAGSVAVNISLSTPLVGVLMESVWTLSEVARFRVSAPSTYDEDFPEEAPEGSNKSLLVPGESRKRRPSRDVFERVPKEEVWGVCDVVWIHEQQTQDVAVVKIVDAPYVGVEYTAGKCDMTYASSLSASIVSKDSNPHTGKVRLMRKDEVCLVTPKTRNTRSPKIMMKEPCRVHVPIYGPCNISSIVAESSGVRILWERPGSSRFAIVRCSLEGKILSEHMLPIFPPALYGPTGERPSLHNYGEDSLLLLRDGNGAVVPLVRDAIMGFREPIALSLPPIRHFGMAVNLLPSITSSKAPTHKASLVTFTAPSLCASQSQLPSVMQHVLFCDTVGVKRILDAIHELGDPVRAKDVLLNERSDSGCNLIHAAVRLSVAAKNKDDVDPGTTHGFRLRDDGDFSKLSKREKRKLLMIYETKMARDEARDLDQRWQRLIRANRSGNEAAAREEPSVIQAAPMQDNVPVVQSPGDSPKAAAPQDMPNINPETSQAVSDVKERQKKAIEMVAVILEHPATQPVLFQLLTHRDYGGLTPFQAAVNIRAYGAATSIWTAIQTLVSPASPSKTSPSIKDAMQKLVHPAGSRPDDNPLFLLCFNDTCTFTFTGEEHINQDIFECRTCGLTGTLCCCTECAFTCHRNHDCKLKRTSPTAYCDCWEKCPCKALIAGNQDKREALLKELLKHTQLFEHNNNRGEHIMMFLARTLGRQQSEQSNSNRRRRHPPPSTHADPASVPEHDLEPPKFARFALEACISEWPVVKSLIEIGMRSVESMPPSFEDVLCLNSQNGSTHLDKFVFMLVSKCGDQAVSAIIESMITMANVSDSTRDPGVDQIIGRFVRSILRIYLLLSLMSPTAAATAIRGKSTAPRDTPQNTDRRSFHAIGMSGMFSVARIEPKESKQQLVANVILRCRTVLMSLVPYAVEQTANAADSLLAPVRYGILRPSCSLVLSPNQDCLEIMEKFLNGEFDLTTHLSKQEIPHRKRKTSRRDTETETRRRDDSEDDSDSEGDGVSSRRHNSQSMNDTLDIGRDTSPQRKTGMVGIMMDDDDESDGGSSSSESDSEDEDAEDHVMMEDDENVDEDEPEEDEHDERYGENSEGEQEERSHFNNPDEDTQRNENDYPSPTYENSFVAESDSQDASRQEEMNDEEERRDGNVAEPPAEGEEENTRDAVHSETSSLDNNEVRMETEETGVTQLELRAPRRVPSEDALRRRRHNLSWTSRLRFDDLDEETAERDGVTTRVTTSSHARAPPSSQNHSATPASPAETARRSSSDHTPTVFQTSHQLALAFSFSIRLLCDLLKKFHDSPEEKAVSLNWREGTLINVMTKVLRRLAPLWDWMYVVLDRMEAQLRFGNAIMLSGAADVRQKSSKRRESGGNGAGKKEKASDEAPATNSRRDTMEYFMATMRGQEREAGDDYPLVDVDTLRTLVFVFDAYLNYHECLINCKKDLQSARGSPTTEIDRDSAHRFFQRSNSMCFPGAAVTEAWDTFSKNGSRIPLADKHHLLTPEADLHSLFAPQPTLMTWQEYCALSKSLGVPQPLNMSLSGHEDEEMEDSIDEEEPADEPRPMDISDSPDDCRPPSGLEELSLEEIRCSLKEPMDHPANAAMARWKNVVQFITKECHDELLTAYGGELGQDHLLSTVARFSVRQAMFRKLMDKFRGLQTKDITMEVHRETVQLIRDAVFQLNQAYVRRQNAPEKNKRDKEENGPTTVLGSSRVKVRFHDEPGEGTGVARSFYTALAEALHVYRKFPFEELGWEGTSDDYLFGSPNQVSFTIQPPRPARSGQTSRGIAVIRERGAILGRKRPNKRHQLSGDSQIFTIPDEEMAAAEERVNAGAFKVERASEQLTRTRPLLAEAVFFRVKQLRSVGYARIAGMLVDTPVSTMIHCLSSPDVLKQYVEDAVAMLLKVGYPADLAMFSTPDAKPAIQDQDGPHPTSDDSPLFARTCRRGLYAPVPGKLSPMRLNAFRNIGRVIGLSLSQGELFPLKLARHVLKFILNRPVRWLDFQFYDPQIFESMRQMLSVDNEDAYFEGLDLRFTMDVTSEDSEQLQTVPLKEGGEDIPVTRKNVIEYVYRFVEMKLLGPANIQCFSAIQQGIADVVPLEMLSGLTAEDLRLLMCGTDQVCVSTLQMVTSFSDESHAPPETLEKFKQWFWSVVDGLSSLEKQELIFFWTGSPSLPTSPEFLHPQPTVMVRPPDDLFLPTANTCISRLYVPLYSSKKLLRTKLQMAIPNKNFGFV